MKIPKLKKEFYYVIGFSLLLLLLFLILRVQIPAVQKRIVVFGIWFFAEIYLWFAIIKTFSYFKNYRLKSKKRIIFEWVITAFYWLPAVLVGLAALSLAKNSVHNINTTLYLTIMGSSVIQYLIKFILFSLLIPFDMVSYLIKLFKQEKIKFYTRVQKWRSIMLKSALWLYLIGLVFMVYGMIFVAEDFIIREVTIPSKNEIFKEKPLKIVLISDLHLATWRTQDPIKEVVQIVNSYNPDYILVTGDLVQFTSKEMDSFMPILRGLQAQKGIYSVLGNHDYSTYANYENEQDRDADVDRLVALQNSLGWRVLRNESERVVLDSNGKSFIFAGIEFYSPTKMFINKGSIEMTYQNIKPDDFVILLSHSPDVWDSIKVRNLPAHLTVSGHTHGMQVGYYGKNHRWSPGKLIYKYWGGLYHDTTDQDRYLYVNVGLASIGFPSRIGMHPEITVFTIK